MKPFKVYSDYVPKGDQGPAIQALAQGIKAGKKFQTLLGVTGSGKTYTMAKVIEAVQKPTLVIAHNKTLAAQLANEFRSFFPENAVEFFVSYYDYYQPEAYVPGQDLYIEKDSSINDEIDKLRHSATAALFERRDVIIVASVSCIYGLGSPIDYENLVLSLRPGMEKDRDQVIRKLVEIQYMRNDIAFERNYFRVRGDVVEVWPSASSDRAVRIEFFGDEIDRITQIHTITGEVLAELSHISIFPASHYATTPERLTKALGGIREELAERYEYFTEHNQLVEAQRILQRTNYDLEMLQEMGYCTGIENYTRYINDMPAGRPPYTLIDYFPKDFLIFADESHVSIPQIGGMSAGDRARKKNLVDYGFRLPSAYDNRPLTFQEFEGKINQIIFASATPSQYEKDHSENIVEQIIRPTGLLDPQIFVRPIAGQIDDLMGEIRSVTAKGFRVLVTTLTKKMAEDLTDYLDANDIAVRYLHSDIDTMERMEILRDLRLGAFDVLVGINLLREGLDLPEVGLVAILDADKEGYLRSETSLIQTIGRAARNAEGRVIMYADQITKSMDKAITETERRRKIQQAYNDEHHITPKSVTKAIHEVIEVTKTVNESMVAEEILPYGQKRLSGKTKKGQSKAIASMGIHQQDQHRSDTTIRNISNDLKEDDQGRRTQIDLTQTSIENIVALEKAMFAAAEALNFEEAARLRDQIMALKAEKESKWNG